LSTGFTLGQCIQDDPLFVWCLYSSNSRRKCVHWSHCAIVEMFQRYIDPMANQSPLSFWCIVPLPPLFLYIVQMSIGPILSFRIVMWNAKRLAHTSHFSIVADPGSPATSVFGAVKYKDRPDHSGITEKQQFPAKKEKETLHVARRKTTQHQAQIP
jgi:hypothetical protein